MEEKLNLLYCFLKRNRTYNKQVQWGFYIDCLLPYSSPENKLKSLLYHIQQTQSQPNLDKNARFWKSVHAHDKKLKSFASFARFAGVPKHEEVNYSNLFKAFQQQPGWGPKTSALLVKAIYHLHQGSYKKLQFWKDAPVLTKNDQLFLPVDAVIAHIFSRITNNNTKTFTQINKLLHAHHYTCTKTEVWDDLWFWGFITQKGSTVRKLGFNESKYWALRHLSKNEQQFADVKELCEEFVAIMRE